MCLLCWPEVPEIIFATYWFQHYVYQKPCILCAKWLWDIKYKVKCFLSHVGLLSSTDLSLYSSQPDISLCCENKDMGSMWCACLCSSFHRYQVILLGDRGMWEWTTCSRLLFNSTAAGAWIHDHSVISLMPEPLDYRLTDCRTLKGNCELINAIHVLLQLEMPEIVFFYILFNFGPQQLNCSMAIVCIRVLLFLSKCDRKLSCTYDVHIIQVEVLWCCWLCGRKGIRPVKMSVQLLVSLCLGRGADLHMAQLMPLSLAPVNPDWFYLSGTGSHG